MAKKKRDDEDDDKKEETSDGSVAVNDAWTGMLAISLLALILASAFLAWDYFNMPKEPGLYKSLTTSPPGGPPPKQNPPIQPVPQPKPEEKDKDKDKDEKDKDKDKDKDDKDKDEKKVNRSREIIPFVTSDVDLAAMPPIDTPRLLPVTWANRREWNYRPDDAEYSVPSTQY